MTSLFSVFDPNTQLSFLPLPGNWLASALVLIFLPPFFWAASPQPTKLLQFLITSFLLEVRAVLGPAHPPGALLSILSLFFFILFSNFLGLFPYIFTSSSHLVFTASLAFPLWAGCLTWSLLFQVSHVFSHLVPLGTPTPLIPMMVLIETVSNLIRPGALAVRLAANMVAGHLLLSLLGGQAPSMAPLMIPLLLVCLSALMALECAVACIQAYVFSILSSLYLNELSHTHFSLVHAH